MEEILGLIFILAGWTFLRFLLSAGSKTVGAAAKAAVGKGTFSDNMEVAFRGMGPMEARIGDLTDENDNGADINGLSVEIRGLFPVVEKRDVTFVTSIIDATDPEDEPKPILSSFEQFQESETVAFQFTRHVGHVNADQGFGSWTRAGVIIPELLQAPSSGHRKLKVILRLVDSESMPPIQAGFCDADHPGHIATYVLDLDHFASDLGYEDQRANLEKARALSLKIGIAVAMADGSLAESEGNVLKTWATRVVSSYSSQKQHELKKVYNLAMRDGYNDATNGHLNLDVLIEEMNEVAETASKYQAIELCFEVMSADGAVDPEELKVITQVATALELDVEKIKNMRDQSIISLDSKIETEASIEDILGFDESWNNEDIQKHLRTEFQKWNNRLTTLEEGDERNNAQRMLELIAEARKKYAK